jgi:Zn-dependent protease
MPTKQGALPLFHFRGIQVYLHWSWFLIAVWEIQGGARRYSSIGFSVAEYLALFVIVLIHEFGHALACRQVGGQADMIVLWPFGGVAYVNPPQRPGATLWSIAAGPLVNVVLLPVTLVAYSLAKSAGAAPDVQSLLYGIAWINGVLLAFNIMPVYPLDGGQILRSLLWFVIGRARSLMVATVIGFIGIIGFVGLAVVMQSLWLGILAVFLAWNCWAGLQHARVLWKIASQPKRPGFRCPACRAEPPMGPIWRCSTCKQPFDTFVTGAKCPHCQSVFPKTQCFECGAMSLLEAWRADAPAPITASAITPK